MDAFADKVCDVYQPGDIVMVHDYPLMMLPHILRSRLPNIYLTFSLHATCPFYTPPAASLRPLSKVLAGALGADIISFQAPIHFETYLAWCALELPQWAPYMASPAADVAESCAVYPMAIDKSQVIPRARGEAIGICNSLLNFFGGKKIIVSYSTVDFRREMIFVTQALNRLEELFPRWRGKVVLLQITSVPWFSRYEEANGLCVNLVQTLADQRNSPGPRKMFTGRLSKAEYYALLRVCDTAIFPFARGGLMKAALDFVACQRSGNKRPVISEINPLRFQLPAAILFPQGDVDGIAWALNRALECSDQSAMEPLEGLEPFMLHSAEEWESVERDGLYLPEWRPSDGSGWDANDGSRSDGTWSQDTIWSEDSRGGWRGGWRDGWSGDSDEDDSRDETSPEPDDADDESDSLPSRGRRPSAESEDIQSMRPLLYISERARSA
ncbi:hypothetical protein TrVFT333_009134 [Trichoderma virens FT-333]|nr:hypothetical protein TrVFT333_009134 [Trichoderma virens FT-333]